MNLEWCRVKATEIPYVKGHERIYSCVVTKKGKLLSHSPNYYTKSHPLQRKYSLKNGFSEHRCYLHSELASVVSAAKFNVKQCKIYVVRVNRCGIILDSQPCKSCMSFIKDSGFISSIEFGIGV